MEKYQSIAYGPLNVYFLDKLNGGGTTFGQDFIPFIAERIGKVDRVFEWCAGPGFIGFSLLANGLCNSLCIADINPDAIEMCSFTVEKNGLKECVSVYQSNCLDRIPENEKWDLVVGNPPHSGSKKLHPSWGPKILYMDNFWMFHRKFYCSVANHLKSESNVIIQENGNLSKPIHFKNMISKGGMKIIGTYTCPTYIKYYFLWSKMK